MKTEKPKRKKHSYIQKILAPPKDVFPLLCPVMEVEWVPDWMPKKVVSESGVAEQECIFITPSEPHDAIWIVTKHDPANLCVEMYKITPKHSIAKIEVSLTAVGDNVTEALISYEFTALSRSGEDFLQEFTTEWYESFMVNWQDAMNRYLAKVR